MNNLTSEQKAKFGRVLGLVGCGLALFLPLIGLPPLMIGLYYTHKQETIEEKHSFYLNLVGLIGALIIFIFAIVSTFAG